MHTKYSQTVILRRSRAQLCEPIEKSDANKDRGNVTKIVNQNAPSPQHACSCPVCPSPYDEEQKKITVTRDMRPRRRHEWYNRNRYNACARQRLRDSQQMVEELVAFLSPIVYCRRSEVGYCEGVGSNRHVA